MGGHGGVKPLPFVLPFALAFDLFVVMWRVSLVGGPKLGVKSLTQAHTQCLPEKVIFLC